MPRFTDRDEIRALLETDRRWAVYALGDLAPGLFERCEWYGLLGGEPALALLFRGFETPVLFTLGAPAAVRAILEELPVEPRLYLMVRPEIVPLLKTRFRIQGETAMWRMSLEPDAYRVVCEAGVSRLAPADFPGLQRLYADGEATGEAPDCFSLSMLEKGVFFGIREGGELVAAAGTHLVVPTEGVGAIGNVYTRRDRRGRGLASRVTSAVAGELLNLGLETIALNVSQANPKAERVYERLGFRRYCGFCEGLAVREDGPHPPAPSPENYRERG
jgi:ribosomal protein S18 acetylase RimI-like enzyme